MTLAAIAGRVTERAGEREAERLTVLRTGYLVVLVGPAVG